mmetsp:Transcript_47585/g.101111  ORF Transcript_47585/g.101111 Transcript_47585/m.101111 type:complete len:204 (-) Transcript_47585:420-1031(-)
MKKLKSGKLIYDNLVSDRVFPINLIQKYSIRVELLVHRSIGLSHRFCPIRDHLIDIVKVMQQHLSEQLVPGAIFLNLLGANIVKFVVLLNPQEQRRTDGVVQLPPRDVAVIVLRAVLVRVAVRGEVVRAAWGVVDAAEGGGARGEALAEGAALLVVLVAEVGEVVGGAGDAEGAGVGADALVVLVRAEDVAVYGVFLQSSRCS